MSRKSDLDNLQSEIPTERYFVAVPTPSIIDVLTLSDEDRDRYMGWWQEASQQRYGLRIEVAEEDTDLLIHGLLQARAEHGGFDDLILSGTTSGVVFISKKGKH